MAAIKDVARLAGVSFKTVSRVINRSPYVTEAIRQRVLRAADSLEYRPHHHARQMRTQDSKTLAFISDDIATTPFLPIESLQIGSFDRRDSRSRPDPARKPSQREFLVFGRKSTELVSSEFKAMKASISPSRVPPIARSGPFASSSVPTVSRRFHLEFRARSSSERLRAFEKNTTSPFFDRVPLWLPSFLGSKSGSKPSIGHGRI
jgi:Bacterial regulatory proteins, lacI family